MRNSRSLIKRLLFIAHDDEIIVRRGRAVILTACGLVFVCLVAFPVLLLTNATPVGYLNIVAALLVYSGVIYTTRRGHVLASAIVFNVMNALGPTISMFSSTSIGAPFYLVFIPLLAAATLPPGAVAVTVISIAPLLGARYAIVGDDPILRGEVLSSVLILMLSGVVAFVLSLTSESSIRRVKRALAELSELNATLEERVRARTADLAAAEQRRRDTMKGVGHDMGNLLMMMSGNATFAAEALEQGNLAEARDFLATLEATTLRLGRVAADLMDSALAETGQLTLQPIALDLAAVTKTVLDEVGGFLARAELTASIENQSAPRAIADADRMKRVMHNIIGNAIKFTPHGGRITITIYAAGERVVWICQDTGCGVAPEKLQLLGQELLRFEPIERHGMGLGLYTATLIVRANGGEISYESPGIGAGTSVRISLPLAPPAITTAANLESPALAA